MDIVLKNCNSIDSANITIHPKKLNIKYGINGTGKTTIGRAIELAINNSGDLSSLKPFKYQGLPPSSEQEPQVEGLSSIKSVMVFNEDYVNQIVFKEEEILNNSFEIFIKTKEYDAAMAEIASLVSSIKETFQKDVRIESFLKDLIELNEAFGKPNKDGSIAASAPINKAIGKGNTVKNIPDELIAYKPFLETPENFKWIKWQTDGNQFLDLSEDCPYCTSPIAKEKSKIKSVEKTYNSKNVQHLNKLLEIVERLGEYFEIEAKNKILQLIGNKTGLSDEQKNFLAEVRTQIDILKDKIATLREVSFYSFKGDDDVEKKIKSMIIDIECFSHLSSPETKSFTDAINQSLNDVLENIGKLKGKINIQRESIKRTIQNNKKDINFFLENAGYEYHVDIEEVENTYKLTLRHKDAENAIANSSAHLSYGEKNAFAIILFMHACLAKNPDLIILDDPISSYDKNKKFAIIDRLFNEAKSFRGKTVLMLTHDFEPIVDMIKTLNHKFQPSPIARFLSNKFGILTETEIEKSDITTFGQVCRKNIEGNKNNIIKCIYLRRYYEALGDKGSEYNVLSSLVHHRDYPTQLPPKQEVPMDKQDVNDAIDHIKQYIPDFDYDSLLATVKNSEEMKTLYNLSVSNYEKLQIFRIINPYEKHGIKVIEKFINETFHIENEYIMQLDPAKYEIVPHYLISKCDECMNVEPDAIAS